MGGSEAGLIAQDPKTHIISLNENGMPFALCGLGAIIRRLPGEFQAADPLNCPGCEARRKPVLSQ